MTTVAEQAKASIARHRVMAPLIAMLGYFMFVARWMMWSNLRAEGQELADRLRDLEWERDMLLSIAKEQQRQIEILLEIHNL